MGGFGLTLSGVTGGVAMVDHGVMRPGTLDRRPVVSAWRRLLREEEGVALVLAILIMVVLTTMLTAVIFLTAAGARDAQRTNAGQRAYSLAESGVNNALAVLEANYPGTVGYPGDNTLLTTCPASLPAVCARTTVYPTGTVSWSGTLDNAPAALGWSDQWNIVSTATVANPTGPSAAAVTRTVKAVVPVIRPLVVPIGQNNPLNFIYGNAVNFQQSVQVASPVYAINDLHLQNSSTISEWIGNSSGHPNKVAVGGNFYEEQNANQVGHTQCAPVSSCSDPANALSEMYVHGQCSVKSNGTLHACAWGSADQIWATTHGNTIPANFLDFVPKLTCCSPYTFHAALAPLEAARSTMGEAYRTADLGPLSPCTTGSLPASVFPRGFDTASGVADLDLNNSATPTGSAAIDLTPSTSYSCKSRAGELSWDNSANKLRVQGTVFIDGSATISSAAPAQAKVTGQGALFLTGTFMMKNALMCVKTTGNGNGTHCDTSAGAWDPNVGALIIVADGDPQPGCTGPIDVTQGQSNNITCGQGINIKSSDFQGALIANKDVGVDTTSVMQGPMLSVYNTVNAGQSNVLTFPPILFSPSGETLLGPPPVPKLLPPQQFGGG
jgi:Tfp pilus assembly protein PilX